MPWAEGGAKLLSHPGIPRTQVLLEVMRDLILTAASPPGPGNLVPKYLGGLHNPYSPPNLKVYNGPFLMTPEQFLSMVPVPVL